MVLCKNEPGSELPEDEESRKRLVVSKVLTEMCDIVRKISKCCTKFAANILRYY